MINKNQFDQLIQAKGNALLSIYLPTYKTGNSQEDRIRFKNALADASTKLRQKGLDNQEVLERLSPAYQLMQKDDFWLHLSEGIALFLSDKSMEYYVLPIDFNPLVYVGNQYYLSPILPLMTQDSRFFLLALSQNEIRFFEGSKYFITPVYISDLVPENIEETLTELETGRELHQTNSNQSSDRPGKVFKSISFGIERDDEDVERFLRKVDKGLMNMLSDEPSPKPPMVIASVEEHLPMYRSLSNYPNIMKSAIAGNPEVKDPVRLHTQAWEIVGPYFEEQKRQYREEFGQYLAEGKATFSQLDTIPAAMQGRIEVLFLNKDAKLWGQFDEETQKVLLSDEESVSEVDLFERAAIATYDQDGKVYIVDRGEMPRPSANVNAILRY